MKKAFCGLLVGLCSFALTGCGMGVLNPEVSSQPSQPSYEISNADENEQMIQRIYQLYKKSGGTLTYEQWLESIRGQDGTNGKDGKDGKDGANGQDGIDGKTPYIGSNGNWWIGNSDTGVRAEGKDGADGQDGDTPYIGTNGNWWIGDSDTGVLAGGNNGVDGSDGADGNDGKDGKSAYEIYKVYHPNYTGDEEQWITDLVNGVLSNGQVHTVTFDTNGGTSVDPQQILHGEKADKPTNPTKGNYVFDDWVDEYGDHWMFNGCSVTKDMTLYATWSAPTSYITYALNGGINHESNPVSFKETSKDIVLQRPTKNGYLFKGWYDDQGERIYAIPTGTKEDVKANAVWVDDYTPITTTAEFLAIANNLDGKYMLMNDLDFNNVTFNPINNFNGVFDGGAHVIRNTANALFNRNLGTVENLRIENAATLENTDGPFVLFNLGSIKNCSYKGNINKDHYSNQAFVGGIVAWNVGVVDSCFFQGNIHVVNHDAGGYPACAGGICGRNSLEEPADVATIINCYAIGDVYAEGNGGPGYAGGICGMNYYHNKEVANCYYSGNVEGGMLKSTSGYRAGAGFIIGGYLSGHDCYYFTTSTKSVTNGGYGYSGTEMTDYQEMVSTALGQSNFYKYCPKDINGNPVIPYGRF